MRNPAKQRIARTTRSRPATTATVRPTRPTSSPPTGSPPTGSSPTDPSADSVPTPTTPTPARVPRPPRTPFSLPYGLTRAESKRLTTLYRVALTSDAAREWQRIVEQARALEAQLANFAHAHRPRCRCHLCRFLDQYSYGMQLDAINAAAWTLRNAMAMVGQEFPGLEEVGK